MRRLEKLNIRIFLFRFKTMEMQRGYKICARKDVLRHKKIFLEFSSIPGGKYRIAMARSILEMKFL